MSWEIKRGTVVTKVGVANFQHFPRQILSTVCGWLKGAFKKHFKEMNFHFFFSIKIQNILVAQVTEKL